MNLGAWQRHLAAAIRRLEAASTLAAQTAAR